MARSVLFNSGKKEMRKSKAYRSKVKGKSALLRSFVAKSVLKSTYVIRKIGKATTQAKILEIAIRRRII